MDMFTTKRAGALRPSRLQYMSVSTLCRKCPSPVKQGEKSTIVSHNSVSVIKVTKGRRQQIGNVHYFLTVER
jgi:hypothetical protein